MTISVAVQRPIQLNKLDPRARSCVETAYSNVPGCTFDQKKSAEYILTIPIKYENQHIFPADLYMEMVGIDSKNRDKRKSFFNSLKGCGIKGVDYVLCTNAEYFARHSRFFKRPIYLDQTKYNIPETDLEFNISMKDQNSRIYMFLTPSFLRSTLSNKCMFIWKVYDNANVEMRQYFTHKQYNQIVMESIEKTAQDKVFMDSLNKNNQDESLHNEVRDHIADLFNGTIEVPNKNGISDVESERYVFEIKPLNKWANGLGQALAYSQATGKEGKLCLFTTDQDKTVPQGARETCKESNIDLLFIRKVNDELYVSDISRL
jgi:hypothetical protein